MKWNKGLHTHDGMDGSMNRSRFRFSPRLILLPFIVFIFLSVGVSPACLIGAHHVHAADVKYTCGMHPMIITDEPGLCPICNMELTPMKEETAGGAAAPKGERKVKYWVAPMDPTYIRDEPGKSPMGMDLVPVYEDEAPGGSIITIDPVTTQNMGVRTATVTRRDLHRVIRTSGLVAYEEPRQYVVNAKIDGWIERLHVSETGRQVIKGEPLLDIYSPELVSAQEEFLLALDNAETLRKSPFPEVADGGKRLLEASRARLRYWDIPATQIARLEKSRQARRTLTLVAPYDGIVTHKGVEQGAFVKAGTELLRVSDISRVWVNADIYEYELPWVRVGQSARIILPYAGGEELVGEVTYLYPFVDPKTRTVKARIAMDNPDFALKPDMYVTVRIEAQPVEGVLAIPAEAVLHSGERRTTFVSLGDGKFEPRLVKTGLEGEDGYVEVVQGILDGERVVTSAQFMFDSESKLREAIEKMLNPKSPEEAKGGGADDIEDLFGEEEELEDLF